MVHPHPATERTFVILKPDAVQRGLIGEIIKRFERVGLKVTHLSFQMLDQKRVNEHYGKEDEWYLRKGNGIIENRKAHGLPVEKDALEYGKDIIRVVEAYMISGPVVILVLQGNQAVAVVKKLVGSTEPTTSDVGTIRGDFTLDSYSISALDDRGIRNLIHCSDSPEEAEREIKLWLTEDQILKYRLVSEQILYDVNLDGIME
ncbi:MAG TPA: nucleoside-diphosphate kinase [Candidatus Paceibacterota bacterium]|nr:nucleoside-diphosphate kinase [Candidatus Paceibacterota bacterium]